MGRIFLALAACLGGLGVALGAFAAHALRAHLPAERLVTFQTGVLYHWLHALALFGVAWACERFDGALIPCAGWCFLAGTLLFSGSLYALAITGLRPLGIITPVGGLVYLVGWLCLGIGALRAP